MKIVNTKLFRGIFDKLIEITAWKSQMKGNDSITVFANKAVF